MPGNRAISMIYFLDFDGVLHPIFPRHDLTDSQNAHFSFVKSFERAVLQCPHADIVIASTWRHKYSLEEMRRNFSPHIAKRIIGVTPKVGTGNGEGDRQAEVEAWLELNGRVGEPWIGIDDFPELYCPGAAVVACHDQFAERETALLLEAHLDHEAFAKKYPVRRGGEKKIIAPGLNPH